MFKKILAIAIVGLMVPSISQAASFENNLTYGAKNNDDVRELQEFLKDQKLFTGPITGNYFSLTRSAVIRFQQKNGVKPANGQFTTSTRLAAQKFMDLEQDVTEPVSEPSAYLDYPVGTTLQSSAPVVGGQTFDQTLNTQTTPTIIYYPVFVPQTEPTTTIQPQTSSTEVSSTPVVEGPKDTVAPKIVDLKYTKYGQGGISWSKQNVVNSCSNCIVLTFDEPTTVSLSYLPWVYDGSIDNNKSYSDKVQTWNDDGKLSDTHVFMMKGKFLPYPTKYNFIFTAKDAVGNDYVTTINTGIWGNRDTSFDPEGNNVLTINGQQTNF